MLMDVAVKNMTYFKEYIYCPFIPNKHQTSLSFSLLCLCASSLRGNFVAQGRQLLDLTENGTLSIIIDRMQPCTKEKKLNKGRKRSLRNSHLAHLAASLPAYLNSQEEEARNRMEMSNLQLFLWKTQTTQDSYPSAFQLIRVAPHPDPHDVTFTHLLHPSFPVLSYKVRELVGFASLRLQDNSFARTFAPLQHLFAVIAQQYLAVSYHNFSHAFTLMLLNFQCIEKQPALKALFTPEEEFCITVAALSHDLGHKGTNNHFQVQNKSELARLSDNCAVLEQMHVRTLWQILQENPHLDFLPLLPNQQHARHIITRLILSTDMATHSHGITALRNLRTAPLADHKWTLMEQLFHACDIGNPCLDYDIYMGWAALLAFQFDAQAKQEEKMGLEVSRGFIYRGLGSLYSDQEWFLGSIVQPLWREISQILPNLSIFRTNVEHNLQKIKEEIRACTQE